MPRPKPSKVQVRRRQATFAAPTWLRGLAIILLVLVVYWPTLSNQFVWQDVATIERNIAPASDPAVHEGRWTCPALAPSSSLVRGVCWLEHRLGGLAPRGYHLIGLAAHAISALLIWRLLILLEVPGALLAAMFFAVHPVCVASVAWVSAIAIVVSCTMCLASLLAFWHAVGSEAEARPRFTHRRGACYGLAIVLYVAALFSDPVSIALPVVLIVIFWWKYGRLTQGMLACVLPLAVLALLAVTAQATAFDIAGQLQPPARAVVAGRACWFYASKLVFPDRLLFIYPRWEIDSNLWWQWVPLAAWLLVVAVLWRIRARIGRGPCAAALIFAIILLPQFITSVAMRLFDTYVADHLLYHASLAPLALLAAALVYVMRQIAPGKNSALVAVSIVVLAPLGLLAERRTHLFHDRSTLDRHTLAHNPAAWVADHDQALDYQQQGHLDEAIQAEYRAIEVLSERRRGQFLPSDNADDLAGCHAHLAILLEQAARGEEAQTTREQAITIREELVRRQPLVPAYRDHLAWTYVDMAFSLRGQRKVVDALEWFRKAAAQQQAVLEAYPSRYSTQSNLATNYVDIGLLELGGGRAAEATTAFADARDIRQRLVEAFPFDPKYSDGLAWCYVDLALVETWMVHREDALRLLRTALELRERLVRDYPEVAEYREGLASLQSDIGLKARQLEDFAAAEEAFRSALVLRERLAHDYPGVDDYQDKLAANYVDIGSVQRTLGQLAAAEKSYREAIAVRAHLVSSHPENKVHVQRLAGSYVELGIVEREAGHAADSLASCQRAIEICQKLIGNSRDETVYQAALAWAYENLGLAHSAAGHTAEAVATCETVLRMIAELARKSGGDIGRQVDLGRAYTNLAAAQFASGMLREAEANHRQALEVHAQLIQDGPAVEMYKHLTAASCRALADVLRARSSPRGAAALYQAALDIHQSLVAVRDSKANRAALRNDLIACADVSAELGEWSNSAAAYARARQYDTDGRETAVACALAQLAAGNDAGYRETCAELLRNFENDVSPQSSFLVALALIVGEHGLDADAALGIARRAAATPFQPGSSILVAAAQYRAGMIDDAATSLAESLRVLTELGKQTDRSLALHLIGSMLLADVYRDQNDVAALTAQLSRLDDLILESLVASPARQDDFRPAWLVQFAVELARRESTSLRQSIAHQ